MGVSVAAIYFVQLRKSIHHALIVFEKAGM